MKVTWHTSFADAIDRMKSLTELVSSGVVTVGERTIRASDPVSLQMEIESAEHGIELEFEIKSLPASGSTGQEPVEGDGESSSPDIGEDAPSRIGEWGGGSTD